MFIDVLVIYYAFGCSMCDASLFYVCSRYSVR